MVVPVAKVASAKHVAARAPLPCLQTHELVLIVVELQDVVVPAAKVASARHVAAKEGFENSGEATI